MEKKAVFSVNKCQHFTTTLVYKAIPKCVVMCMQFTRKAQNLVDDFLENITKYSTKEK